VRGGFLFLIFTSIVDVRGGFSFLIFTSIVDVRGLYVHILCCVLWKIEDYISTNSLFFFKNKCQILYLLPCQMVEGSCSNRRVKSEQKRIIPIYI
jgi:hypothetical protein